MSFRRYPAAGGGGTGGDVNIHDSAGNDILSTIDSYTLKNGLDVNLLNSGIIADVNGVMDPPFSNAAMSVGFLNGGTLVTPSMNVTDNSLIVDATQKGNIPVTIAGSSSSVSVSLDNVNGSTVNYVNAVPAVLTNPTTGNVLSVGTGVADSNTLKVINYPTNPAGLALDYGAGNYSSSTQRVVIATNSPTINANVTNSASLDVLGVDVTGTRNNQIEIDFNTAPSATLLTTTTAGGGTITQSNGQTQFATNTALTASAKGVSVGIVQYRPAHEIYAYFSAGFTPGVVNSYQRIGLYDTNNGFFIGWNQSTFGITKRTGAVDTFTARSSWNTDLLDGNSSSKFTRNGTPEAINLTFANLFRIRFAWLGSANILFDVFSPDGQWVTFHNIKQPNSASVPSLTVPNLPMTVDVSKNASVSTNLIISTACWAAGSTSGYSKITDTLTDNTLASMTRAVITGISTGGGGSYQNVKVNPSGALTVDSTVSSSALPTGASTSALQTTGNAALTSIDASLTSINNKTPALGSAASAASQPVVIASDQIVPVKGQSVGTTGNITTLNGSVAVAPNGDGGAYIDLRGTFVATVTFQGSVDGTTFFNIPAMPAGSAQNVATVTSATVPGAWQVNCAGMVSVRATATAFTSGTITATLRTSPACPIAYVAPVGATNSVAIASGTVTTVSTVTAVTGITNTVTVKQTSAKGQFIRNDYTVTPVTTGAYVQLIASTSSAYSALEIFDSSGQTLVLAIGAAASEVDQFIIFPGGNGRIPFTLATAQRISIKALSATANVGEIDINFYV